VNVGLAPPKVLVGPAKSPPIHGLLSAAEVVNESDEKWILGYVWEPDGCGIVQVWSPICDPQNYPGPVDFSDPLANLACVETQPVMLELMVERESWGFAAHDFPGRPLRMLEAAAPWGLERDFWTGAATVDNDVQNQHLATSTAVVLNTASNPVTGMSPKRALATLIGGLSDCPGIGRGVIHAPTELAVLWGLEGVEAEGDRLRTKVKGHAVAAGDGYPGTGPTGKTAATPPAGMVWAYATGPIQVRMSAPEITPDTISEALDRKNNTVAYRASRYGAVNFDPCCGPLAVLVNLDA